MKKIKILGEGISGLTAAINLKKAGFNVEVYERKSYCGKYIKDFEFLENWTYDEDVFNFLRNINIETNFYKKICNSVKIISPSLKKYVGKSNKNLMYLVKRGQTKDSIDKSLENQAKKSKIKILYNSFLKPDQADIIAAGSKRPTWIANGIKFRCKHPDEIVTLLDNNLSFRVYSYLIINDNIGEITCVNPIKIKNIKTRLNLTIKKFEKILNIKIKNIEERFSAGAHFGYLSKEKINNQYFVGEAAGFQDDFYGFGMIYAFKSGYCAARSIIENIDYDKLWKKEFLKQLKVSAINRRIYERLSNEGFEKLVDMLNSKNFIITRLRGGEDLKDIMKRLYNNPISLLLRPLLF